MSYKCEVCDCPTSKNQKRILYKNVSLCPICWGRLQQYLGGEVCFTRNVSELIARDIVASIEAHGSFPAPTLSSPAASSTAAPLFM
jgi:hypothetical protein